MNRRKLSQIAVLALAGLIVRLAVFMDVGVNGDTGLYLYDAKQILWGRQLLVEFPSRSPVMEYLLAGVLALDFSPILSARAFMVAVATVLGVCIYAFGRQLHSHRVGLMAAGLFYLTPFSVVWGLWVKTEQVAGVFLVTAFVIALAVIDRRQIPVWAMAVVGVLFGVAFLVRMVAIVHIAAFAIFIIIYRLRNVKQWRSTTAAGVGVVGVALAVILVAYYALAGFELGGIAEIAHAHGLALVASNGQGGLGWIQLNDMTAVTAESRTAWWAKLCQKCGRNTVIIFMATGLVTLPATLPLLVLFRSYFERAGFVGQVVFPVAAVIAGLAGLAGLMGTTYWARALGAAVLIFSVILVWWLPPVPWKRLWRPTMALPMLVSLALAAGYLYRDRILYMTYFQDFYPYVVTLSAICIAEFVDTNFGIDKRRAVNIAIAVLLTTSMITAVAYAYPYNPDRGGERDWFSVQMVQQFGEDIQSRTEPGDRILAAQPLYVIESDRRLAGDLSRKYYLFDGWPNDPLTNRVDRQLAQQVRSGSVAYVIDDKELHTVYNGSTHIEPAVSCAFKPAENQPTVYGRLNSTLLTRKANATC